MKSLNFVSNYSSSDGYGIIAERVTLDLIKMGVDVSMFPLNIIMDGFGLQSIFKSLDLDKSLFNRLIDRIIDKTAPCLLFNTPDKIYLNLCRYINELTFINTMYESSLVPPSWVSQLNAVPLVIVPTSFVAQSMRDSGVNTPIVIIPEGYDSNIYSYIDRPKRETFTTLMVGPLEYRKNPIAAIEGWKMAFQGNKNARLILRANHSQFGKEIWEVDDSRITWYRERKPTKGIVEYYQKADVLLALGNEGFGVPLVEGMATGLPVIALDTEGQADICGRGLTIDVPGKRQVQHVCPHYGEIGMRWEPDAKDVADRLQWVYRNQGQAKSMAEKASVWVKENRDISLKAAYLVEAMSTYV